MARTRTTAIDLDRLQADADACLDFLIGRQDEWQPVMRIVANRAWEDRPVTLIAVSRAS